MWETWDDQPWEWQTPVTWDLADLLQEVLSDGLDTTPVVSEGLTVVPLAQATLTL